MIRNEKSAHFNFREKKYLVWAIDSACMIGLHIQSTQRSVRDLCQTWDVFVDDVFERELIALLSLAVQGDATAYGRFFDLTVWKTLEFLRTLAPPERGEELLAAVHEIAWNTLPAYDCAAMPPSRSYWTTHRNFVA